MRFPRFSLRPRWWLCLLLTFVVAGTPAFAEDEPFTPDQERVLQLAVGRYVFDDLLLCYQVGETLYVPLGQLAQLIDLAVQTYPVSGHAEGFIFRESRTFLLDVGQRMVVVGGVQQALNPERVRVLMDDIYVDSSLVATWFPFALEPNLLNSQLVIRSETPLPFEERLKREARGGALSERAQTDTPSYPRQEEPYRIAEVPYIDQTLRVGAARDVNGKESTGYAYTTYGSGDLLWMDSSWYYAGNSWNDSPDIFRMTLSRKDPDGKLLGPVGLTEVSVGHVQEPRVNLVNQPMLSEPGMMFSNMPLYRSSTFDSQNFVGDLLPGWEVELYQNNVLLGYQTPNGEGQYRFDNVPLLYGSNYFRLVFYGPQGQRHEETQQFEVGQSQTPVGEQYYRVMAREDTLGGNRGIIDYSAGLLQNLSFSGNVVSLPLTEADGTVRQHDYVRAGFNTSISRAVLSIGYIDDNNSGSASDVRVQGRIGASVIGLNQTLFNHFVSEEFRPGQLELQSRTQLRMDSSIPGSTWTPMLPMTLELLRDQYDGDLENKRANFRLSMQKYAFAVSNMLTWSKLGENPETTFGVLQTSMRRDNLGLRMDYQYAVAPEFDSTSLSLAGDLTNFHHYNLHAGVTHLIALKRTTVNAGASRDFGSFIGMVSLRYGDLGDYLVEVGVNFSLGRNPRSGEWTSRSYSLARYGAVAPRVYLDTNANGQQDPDEEALSNVAFRFDGVRRPAITDEQGDALITGALPYKPLDVTVDAGSLADPSYTPAREGVSVVNRPGHATEIDFPIVITGEIDGVVTLNKEGRVIEVGGVVLELVGMNGEVMQRTRTAFDGFYLFSKVPAGFYEVRISPEQTTRLGLVQPEPRAAALRAPEWYASGVDFRLEMESGRSNR